MPVGFHLAVWTPLPPLHNGIADYSVELLAYLSGRYDIEVFIDTGYEPASWLMDRYSIFRHTAFEARHRQQPFDLIIYQLGGSHHHYYMFEAIQQWRGLVVLHDLFMGLPLYRYYAQRNATNRRFIRYLAQEGRQIEREFKTLLRIRGATHDAAVAKFFDMYYLLDWVVKSSLGQVVHMDYAAQELNRQYPNARPHVVNMGVRPPDMTLSAQALRTRFGLDPSTFVVGIFGKINKYKGHQICLAAVQKLRHQYSNILVVIVGPHIQSDYFDQLRAMVDANGMRQYVHFAGYLDQAQFDRTLLVCDVVVNLRYPGQMQMSATLIRALAAGKPVIISDIKEWAMLPEDVCLRIQHGANDVDALQGLLKRLLVEPDLRQSLSRNAHRYVQENATLEVMGSQYDHVIAQVTHDRTASAPIIRREPSALTTATVYPAPSTAKDELPGLPMEQVSQREINQLLREWHQLQKSTSLSPVIKRTPRFVEFLLNLVRRVRYLGSAWQLQGLLHEAMLQRHEMLDRKLDYLTEQVEVLKAELDQLRQEKSANHTKRGE